MTVYWKGSVDGLTSTRALASSTVAICSLRAWWLLDCDARHVSSSRLVQMVWSLPGESLIFSPYRRATESDSRGGGWLQKRQGEIYSPVSGKARVAEAQRVRALVAHA